MSELTLEPGSPSSRVALHLQANAGIHLTRRTAAELLNITPAQVDAALQPGVFQGLITCFNDTDDGRCWRAGPRLALWQAGAAQIAPERPAQAVKPAAAPKANAGASGRGRSYLPPLDPSRFVVHKGKPLPARNTNTKGATKYDALFDRLTTDDSCLVDIPVEYRQALSKAIENYMRARPALAAKSVLVARKIDEHTVGVWRLAKGAPGLAEAGGRPARKAA